MPENKSIREWLLENDYKDVAELIEQVMTGWKLKGTKLGVTGGMCLLGVGMVQREP